MSSRRKLKPTARSFYEALETRCVLANILPASISVDAAGVLTIQADAGSESNFVYVDFAGNDLSVWQSLGTDANGDPLSQSETFDQSSVTLVRYVGNDYVDRVGLAWAWTSTQKCMGLEGTMSFPVNTVWTSFMAATEMMNFGAAEVET
jgi:hypothetical protein